MPTHINTSLMLLCVVFLNIYVQKTKCPPRSPFSPASSTHTIVSFLFPREHRDFLSFLVLCDMDEESGVDDDDNVNDEDVERGEGQGVDLGVVQGEVGAD